MGKLQKQSIKSGAKLLSLVVVALQLLSCFSGNRIENSSNSFETPAAFATPKISLQNPLTISTAPEDVAKCNEIQKTISGSEFSNANWGIFAVSLKDGRIMCEKDSQKLFNPASVQKILTSTVALDLLGKDFRWQTSLFSEKGIEDGIIKGDLTLFGRGAPDFDIEGVRNLIGKLKANGLRKIEGDIIGDDSFFTGDSLGDGWAWNEIQWYYGAEASALSINKNQAKITLQNRKATSSIDFVEVAGETKPFEDIEAVGVKRELGHNKVYVWGYGNALDARIAVENPALWSAKVLKSELEKNGIKVDGIARSVDWKSKDHLDIKTAKYIASVESQPLNEIIRRMNKDSVNLYAELILRTLGKMFGESAPDENPKMQRLRGDDSAGASVIKKWLIDHNISAEEAKIHDGSGLSRLDLVTSEAIGRALVFAAQSEFADDFKNSLPIAAIDGTLRGRLGNVSGKIIAKTGSIKYVNALAGFADSKDDSFAFVIFCNNFTGTSDSSVLIDSVAASLVNY